MPLDSVILMLKEILNEETTPALLDCLEPPDLSTIERSYNSLFKSNFISQPGDHGEITHLGAFVSALGIDLTLGALIGLGELRYSLWLASASQHLTDIRTLRQVYSLASALKRLS